MRPNLDVLRSALLPLLTDIAEVTVRSGEPVIDPDTGEATYPTVVVYTGPVLVRPQNAVELGLGGIEITQGKYEVTLPAEADVHVGSTLTVTASTGDTRLVGMALTLTDVPVDSFQVARFCKAEQTI